MEIRKIEIKECEKMLKKDDLKSMERQCFETYLNSLKNEKLNSKRRR